MRAIIIVAALLTLTACGTTPRLDEQFGSSVRQLHSQQTLDKHAIDNRSPVNGLDAQAAAAAYQNYQQSFSTKEDQSNAFSIGVGKNR
ncbi:MULTISPECIES: hypothetical protein [unclassified Duganella]|uniref:hypothetical protein n=1 Tax=unclassified Duganella TaxID=2636909 RepID=UPI0008881C5B|nr:MULTISPECIES: hypothetical protein [unclassified Duganella]SDF93933.1 hypothetical protein SAMN05216320_102102 [Duganella sp. OV458]SDJ10798.1 hypothetical protein SAMN05428973_102449 [Duganella sp. OV510]